MSSGNFRIAIFASGSGSNAEEIIKYFSNHPHITVALILTNNQKAFVLERAQRLNVPARVFTKDEFNQPAHLLHALKENRITHIVLAGFLWLMPEYLIRTFPDRIINIHPALLPKFGGKG